MKNKLALALLMAFAVAALSTSAIFVRLAEAPSSVTAFYRMLFSALALLPFLAANREARASLRALNRRDWLLGLLSGALLASHYVMWFESLRFTSVASSTVLVSLQPLFSIAGGFLFLRERFSLGALAGCGVAILGSAVIGWGDFQLSSAALFGDILAFLAAGLISAYFFVGRALRMKLPAASYSMLGYVSSAALLALYALMTGAPLSGYPAAAWWCFAGLALVPTILGQFVFNWLLKWLNPSAVSMSILGESAGTCILAYFILQEKITAQQGPGMLLILSGLALYFWRQNAAKARKKSA